MQAGNTDDGQLEDKNRFGCNMMNETHIGNIVTPQASTRPCMASDPDPNFREETKI